MRVIETRRQIENIFAVIFKHKRIIIIVKLKTENYFTVILCTSENHLRIPVSAVSRATYSTQHGSART